MKFIGAISSIVTGIMAFICLSITNVVTNLGIGEGTTTGWDLIKLDSDASGIVLFKIFAIVCLVLAVILILYGLFLLLVDLKVVKIKSKLNFYVINNILLTLFVVCAALAFVGLWVYVSDTILDDKIGVGAWLMLIIPAVLCLCSWLFARKQGK